MEPSERYLLAPYDVLVGALSFAALGPRTVRSRTGFGRLDARILVGLGSCHRGVRLLRDRRLPLGELTGYTRVKRRAKRKLGISQVLGASTTGKRWRGAGSAQLISSVIRARNGVTT